MHIYNKFIEKLLNYYFLIAHCYFFILLVNQNPIIILMIIRKHFSIVLFILYYILIHTNAQYTQVNPLWVTSPYFRANNEPVINVLTGSTQTPRYTFTFSSALPGMPNLAYGIKGYKGNDYFGQEYFQITRQYLTASTFSVAIQIFGVTNLWILNVAYIAADPMFPHHLNTFDNVPLNYSQGNLENITVQSSTETTYTNVINYTLQAGSRPYTVFGNPLSGNKILFFITSLFINSRFRNGANLYPVNISVTYDIITQTTYFMRASIYQYTSITRLHFSQIVFNYDDVLASDKYILIFQVWETDKLGGFKTIPQQFVDNFIMGLKDFATIDGRCGINYRWQFQTFNGEFGVKLYQSDFWHVSTTNDGCSLDSIRNTVFYMKTWQCPITHIFFNLTTNMCQDTCGNRYYENLTQVLCEKCHYSCLTCQSNAMTNCTSCEGLDNRILGPDNTCICQQGYFDDGSSLTCQQCPFITIGCLECFFNTLFNGSGYQYSCIKCNISQGLFLNSTSNTCQLCQLTGCVLCESLQKCQICNATDYFLDQITGQCHLHQCGDKILSGLQQCDDGNTFSGDGCSALCTIQPYWSCQIYYCCSLQTNVISFELIKYQKTLNKNQFKIEIQVSSLLQNLYQFENKIANPKRILMIPAGGEPTFYQYIPNKQQILLYLTYNQSLQFPFRIVIFFQIPEPRVDCQQTLYKSTVQIDVDPDNNLPPVFYSQEDYKKRQIISKLTFSMGIVSWFIMIWSIFIGRIIGLELMGVFQLAYLDLTNHNHLNLMLTGLLNLDFVNGFNLNKLIRLRQPQSILPSSIRQIHYSSSFIDNCNIMLFLHIVTMFFGSIIYSMIHYFAGPSKIISYVKSFIKQLMVTLTLFICLNLAFSTGLSFRYNKQFNSNLWIADWLLILIQILLLTGIILLIFSNSFFLGQFIHKFKATKPCRNYIAITIIYRAVLGFYIAYNNQYQICTLTILGLVILYLIYHFVNLPFKSQYHNYRSSICHLTMNKVNVTINCFMKLFTQEMIFDGPAKQ